MKTRKTLMSRVLVIASIGLFSAFTFTACDKKDDDKNSDNAMFAISGNASTSQVVPPVTRGGTANHYRNLQFS